MATREGETADSDRLYTLEEFRALPEEDEYLVELVDGRLVREPRPGGRHGVLVALISRILLDYADRAGGMVVAEGGFVLGEERPTVRGPDVAYIRDAEERYGAPEGFITGAPDLAVEVVSPGNSAAEIRQKVIEYFDSGSSQVWVVHPRTRTVVVHRSASEARVLREHERIDGGRLLPGLDLPVSEVFGR